MDAPRCVVCNTKHCSRQPCPAVGGGTTGGGDGTVFLFSFDLLELNGDDLRREPLEVRNNKATLASVLAKAASGLRLDEHLEHDDGELVFRHACKLGLGGIVSKRLGSRYRSGRSPDWLKFKNPAAPAVRQEAEEDWGRK
jgi:bifunctional non-homologous end joining protein LigD